MAWMAPMAMSSLCAYSTWILRDSALRMASMASLPLARVKSPGLRADDLEVRIGGDDLFEALLAIVGRRGTDRALQLDDVHVVGGVLEFLADPAAGLAAFLDEVRAEEPDIERRIAGHRAVGEDHRNACAAFASCSTVSQPVSTTGENAMTSTFCAMKRAQRLDLVFLLLLRIGETQVDVAGERRRT